MDTMNVSETQNEKTKEESLALVFPMVEDDDHDVYTSDGWFFPS